MQWRGVWWGKYHRSPYARSCSRNIDPNSPVQGAANLSTGPVLVTFDIQNSPVPLSATQPRMHFFVDDDPVPYKFYDGPGITEDGSTSGVRYQGVHTHFAHWKSGGSIQFNALASGHIGSSSF